jgi:hypothetical protein
MNCWPTLSNACAWLEEEGLLRKEKYRREKVGKRARYKWKSHSHV